MDRPPEYTLDIAADRSSVKDVVKAILHTIFFHRYFTPLHPATHDLLDLTLPLCTDALISSTIDSRSAQLLRTLTPHSTITVTFLEKKRRKGWFVAKADEEAVWEVWTLHVSLLSARDEAEAGRQRRATERGLRESVMRVVGIVNAERGHIPPITTSEANPFPWTVVVR